MRRMWRMRLSISRIIVKNAEDITIRVGSRELMKHPWLGFRFGGDRSAARLPLRVLRIDLSFAVEIQPRNDGRRVGALFPELRVGQEDSAFPAGDARYAIFFGSPVYFEP